MLEVRCPVCATSVDGSACRCARCHAPHHAECWSYNAGCGIYACQSVRGQGLGLVRRMRGDGEAVCGAVVFALALVTLPFLGELVRVALLR